MEKITMNEEFVKNIYKTIIEDGKIMYKDLYDNTEVTKRTIDYYKNALELYHSLNDNQKNVFMDVIEQTMIDTISHIFGIFDGSSTLSGNSMEFDIKINGVSTEYELQDYFLDFVENHNN